MALLAGAERGFLPRAEVLDRIRGIVAFLGRAETHHGVFPHFLHGGTGAMIPFSPKDDGGDLVETSYLMMGLRSEENTSELQSLMRISYAVFCLKKKKPQY